MAPGSFPASPHNKLPVTRSPRPCYLPTLAMACTLAACGGDGGSGPDGNGGPLPSIPGLWDASVSGIRGQTRAGQPTSCTATWVMSIDSFPEHGADPLLTIVPYTTPVVCDPGESGVWSEIGQIYAVRQSGDSFTFVSALRGDTFMVVHLKEGNALSGPLIPFTYRDATFAPTGVPVDDFDQGLLRTTGVGTLTITATDAGLSTSVDIRVVAGTGQIVRP
jgi:hypothetical protein